MTEKIETNETKKNPPQENKEAQKVSKKDAEIKTTEKESKQANPNSIEEKKTQKEKKPKPLKRKILDFVIDIILNAVVIIIAVFTVRFFLVAPFQVDGPSMCDTLNSLQRYNPQTQQKEETCYRGSADYIIVNKFIFQNFFGWNYSEPDRGDVIVFHPPIASGSKEYYIKRVIGVAGDTVILKNGKVYLKNSIYPNGRQLREEYLNNYNSGNTHLRGRSDGEFQVPEGKYFVMGDNRNSSQDSRHWTDGENKPAPFLPKENIEGRAWIILWPFENAQIINRMESEEFFDNDQLKT